MNLNNYERKVGLLQAQVGNITQWVWPTDDTQTFGIIVEDWFNGIRPVLLQHFKDRTKTVIQAGGNCGVYPLLYKEIFDTVYTFEPDPLSFFCLTVNCQMPGISKFNCAIGEGPGSAVMNELFVENRGMNKVELTDEPAIPVVAIDSFGFKNVGVIQLDLEGFEPQALRGAIRTIEKYHPMIILECESNYDEVFAVIEPLGYKPLAKITRLDTVFIHQP